MKLSDKGIRFLRQVEGVRADVYKDSAGLPTIGVGHLLTKSELTRGKIIIDGESVRYINGLNDKRVDALLRQDVQIFEEAVTGYVKVPLTQNQFDALVSFAFNVGKGAFEKSTLLRVLNRGGYEGVPEQLKRWIYSGGVQNKGLVNRRQAEIELWNEHNDADQMIKLTCGPGGKLSQYQAPDGSQTVILTGGWVIS